MLQTGRSRTEPGQAPRAGSCRQLYPELLEFVSWFAPAILSRCFRQMVGKRHEQPTVKGARMFATEIIFEVSEDEVDGGYSASALGYGIHTQGDSVEDIRRNVREAVDCYFDDTMPRPKLIRLHFVRDEVLVV